VALLAGCFIGYGVTYTDFNNKLTELLGQLGLVQSASNSSSPTFTFNDNVSLSALYQQVKSSVVIIQDLVPARTFFGGTVYSMQQGSGFITKVNNQLVVVTNNHVVSGSINQPSRWQTATPTPQQFWAQTPKLTSQF
jgi:S1-C subfamily serine protease